MDKRLAKLQLVADMRYRRAAAPLEHIVRRENEIRQAFSDLRMHVQEYEEDAHLASRTGALQAWKQWSGTRREQLNQQLAMILAEKIEATQQARQEFCRKEAIKLVLKKLQKESDLVAIRQFRDFKT